MDKICLIWIDKWKKSNQKKSLINQMKSKKKEDTYKTKQYFFSYFELNDSMIEY